MRLGHGALLPVLAAHLQAHWGLRDLNSEALGVKQRRPRHPCKLKPRPARREQANLCCPSAYTKRSSTWRVRWNLSVTHTVLYGLLRILPAVPPQSLPRAAARARQYRYQLPIEHIEILEAYKFPVPSWTAGTDSLSQPPKLAQSNMIAV